MRKTTNQPRNNDQNGNAVAAPDHRVWYAFMVIIAAVAVAAAFLVGSSMNAHASGGTNLSTGDNFFTCPGGQVINATAQDPSDWDLYCPAGTTTTTAATTTTTAATTTTTAATTTTTAGGGDNTYTVASGWPKVNQMDASGTSIAFSSEAVTANDFIEIDLQTQGNGEPVSSVTDSNSDVTWATDSSSCSPASKVANCPFVSDNGPTLEMVTGVVNTTGTTTITIHFGTTAGDIQAYAMEVASSDDANSWSIVASGHEDWAPGNGESTWAAANTNGNNTVDGYCGEGAGVDGSPVCEMAQLESSSTGGFAYGFFYGGAYGQNGYYSSGFTGEVTASPNYNDVTWSDSGTSLANSTDYAPTLGQDNGGPDSTTGGGSWCALIDSIVVDG